MYQKGDIVKRPKTGDVGKVTSVERQTVYVWSATTGQNGYYPISETEPATREEYDAQTELRLHPPKKAPVVAETKKPVTPAHQTTTVYRWVCLECGNKYNGRECPSCGGDDRIENAGKDLDKRHLFGVPGNSEPMFPKD